MIVTIFDFDDTLFATTEHARNCDCEKRYECKKIDLHLPNSKALRESFTTLLQTAVLHSDKVYIVSNADTMWVETCIKYLDCRIHEQVIVLPLKNTDLSYNQPVDNWKPPMFKKIIEQCFFGKEEKHHVISFGDSSYDLNATLAMKNLFPEVYIKFFLFLQHSNINTLIAQQNFVTSQFKTIVESLTDLRFAIKINGNKNLNDELRKTTEPCVSRCEPALIS